MDFLSFFSSSFSFSALISLAVLALSKADANLFLEVSAKVALCSFSALSEFSWSFLRISFIEGPRPPIMNLRRPFPLPPFSSFTSAFDSSELLVSLSLSFLFLRRALIAFFFASTYFCLSSELRSESFITSS